MIRLMRCIQKRDDLSTEAFRQYWHSAEYHQLLSECVELSGGIRVERQLTLQVGLNDEIQMFRGTGAPFDAVVELFWDDATTLQQHLDNSGAVNKILALANYEEQFIDAAQSRFFMTSF